MKERPQPISYTTEYGTTDVAAGGFRYSERTWFRYDRFTPHDPSSGFRGINPIFAVDQADLSPQHHGYNSQCSCCWLGFGHSELYHLRSLSRPERDGSSAP